MSTDKKPRSLRLTQAHRMDITKAVMKQWEDTNPAPANGTFAEFIMSTLQSLMKVRKNAPAEMKAFKHLIERTNSINTALEHLTPENRELVNVYGNADFNLQILLENSEKGALHNFCIPAEVCDKLGIPYIGTRDAYHGNVDTWRDHATVHTTDYNTHEYIEAAYFPHKPHYITLTLPRNDKSYGEYTKAQREVRKWEEERSKMREEITDYLNQFNTTGQIRDGWPELVDYLPAHLADPERVIQLPALARSRLNERLGLA